MDENQSNTNKNLSKLEEVLKRQRERLESMSGSFNNQPSSMHNMQPMDDQNQRSSGYQQRQSQSSQLTS